MSVNKVILVGNLGKDPETRTFNDGQITKLIVATGTKAYTKNGKDFPERTDWHTVVLTGAAALTANEFLRKGDKIFIEGSIRYRQYTGQDGVEKYSTEILATRMEMLGSRDKESDRRSERKDGPVYQNESYSRGRKLQPSYEEDDLPY